MPTVSREWQCLYTPGDVFLLAAHWMCGRNFIRASVQTLSQRRVPQSLPEPSGNPSKAPGSLAAGHSACGLPHDQRNLPCRGC